MKWQYAQIMLLLKSGSIASVFSPLCLLSCYHEQLLLKGLVTLSGGCISRDLAREHNTDAFPLWLVGALCNFPKSAVSSAQPSWLLASTPTWIFYTCSEGMFFSSSMSVSVFSNNFMLHTLVFTKSWDVLWSCQAGRPNHAENLIHELKILSKSHSGAFIAATGKNVYKPETNLVRILSAARVSKCRQAISFCNWISDLCI